MRAAALPSYLSALAGRGSAQCALMGLVGMYETG
jgi:hypothetical protein